jgi:type IV secretory pathway VirB9-like protein
LNIAARLIFAAALLSASPALSEAVPRSGSLDNRIRTATYVENQVFVIETDLRHSTTIHFGQGERFDAVIVGDTESFQVDPAKTQPKGFEAPRNYSYRVAGDGDFRPTHIYDDGRYTYFTFPENARQPAVFKADDQGRERTVNWTQQGNILRVLGVNQFWTLRIGDEAICALRDDSAIYVSN